jgi:hypothetical protein
MAPVADPDLLGTAPGKSLRFELCQPGGRSRNDDTEGLLQRAGKEAAIMKRALFVGVGLVLLLAGVIFALQGAGAIGGSTMSGVTFWAVAGPVIAVVGLAMAVVGLRRRPAH